MHFLSTDYVWICGGKWNTIYDKWDKVGLKQFRENCFPTKNFVKIKKQIYKVVCRGKRFPLPLYVNESVVIREKVLIQKRIENPESFIRSIRINS